MRQVNLVNEQDEIIGHTDLLDAHQGEGKKHQAISLFLFHQTVGGDFELLLQQRSAEKIVGGRQWANTLCANLVPSENHLACLKRRMDEELGIKWQNAWHLEEIMVFNYQVACEKGFSENEIDHIFVSVLSDSEFDNLQVKPHIDEVFDFAWENWEDVKVKKIGKRKLTSWSELFLDNKEIIKKIDQVLKKCQK